MLRQTVRPHDPAAIRAAAEALARDEGLRPRDVALRLGISEAELLATGVGGEPGARVRKLDADLAGILRDIPGLGPIMALTRNEAAVLEVVGPYGEVHLEGGVGGVFDKPIDLRFFLGRWRHAFAVERDAAPAAARRSLQFFDAAGGALHKVYLRPDGDHGAFDALVDRHAAAEQSPWLPVEPAAERLTSTVPGDAAALRERWTALGDVHEFHGMLAELRLDREQAFRLAGHDLARPVGPCSLRKVTRAVAADGLPVMLFVPNAGCIQIRTGTLRNLKAVGPWWNVLDDGFNLHVNEDVVARSWVVTKPTREGTVTSLELFDRDGRLLLMVFGERHAGQAELPAWREQLLELATAGDAA